MSTKTIKIKSKQGSIKLTSDEILKDYRIAQLSRIASNNLRKEVLMGKAKFAIESAGKELLQIAISKAFKKGDFYSGYYRDQTFMMHKDLATVQDVYASLYADTENDPYSGGRQMNAHYSTPLVDHEGNWLNHRELYNVASAISPLAGQVPHALGIALASKSYRDAKADNQFSKKGNEVSICVIGDASTSEGVFWEGVNAAGVMQVPMIYVIQDDGYGISVPTEYQTTKGSISAVLSGFASEKEGEGYDLYTVKAWDYEALLETFDTSISKTRKTHKPAIVHVKECTQPNGHSTSGSHERYKSAERLQWEKDMDCLLWMEKWITDNKVASQSELDEIKMDVAREFKASKKDAWSRYQAPIKDSAAQLMAHLDQIIAEYPDRAELLEIKEELTKHPRDAESEVLRGAEEIKLALVDVSSPALDTMHAWYNLKRKLLEDKYATHLYSETPNAAITIPSKPATYDDDAPLVNGFEVLNAFFDELIGRDDTVYAFGEDVGKIGGVNQGFAGLQEKYGEERVFDTGIREWTIVGQAIGMAMRGLRPIAEIQYLDYLAYAFSALTDDLATLRYRTNGVQMSPCIIRTRGHRFEGIWHSGSPLGMMINSMRGIYICVPRNMTQAVGMYNTLVQSDDPAIVIECLNGYRKKEKLPNNIGEYTVALGTPEVLVEGSDITLVTYGSCIAEAEKAIKALSKMGISVELVDVQTLLPFDLEHGILESIKKTNKVVFLDEDVSGGATGYMMDKVLNEQGAYHYLDARPATISATDYRPPYADDGDYVCKPTPFDIIRKIVEVMHESNPAKYQKYLAK